jgi:hypothetical protein
MLAAGGVPEGAGGEMRWGTSIVLVVLMLLILTAAVLQFVFHV